MTSELYYQNSLFPPLGKHPKDVFERTPMCFFKIDFY